MVTYQDKEPHQASIINRGPQHRAHQVLSSNQDHTCAKSGGKPMTRCRYLCCNGSLNPLSVEHGLTSHPHLPYLLIITSRTKGSCSQRTESEIGGAALPLSAYLPLTLLSIQEENEEEDTMTQNMIEETRQSPTKISEPRANIYPISTPSLPKLNVITTSMARVKA